jgi:hypothetical protein
VAAVAVWVLHRCCGCRGKAALAAANCGRLPFSSLFAAPSVITFGNYSESFGC